MLKPADSQIIRLARDEASPRSLARHAAITRGPVFAIVALAVLGLLAVPWQLMRLAGWLLRGRK